MKSKVAIAVFCLTATTRLHAQSPSERAERLWVRWADHLPAWCLYTQAFPGGTYSPLWQSPRSDEYMRFFGPTFGTMHHYCWGLAHTHAASLTDDTTEQEFNFAAAIQEFNFVLNRAPDDFRLKPELYVHKGAAQEALEDYFGAVTSYTDAIRLNGEYEPAYIGLSNCFEELGEPQEALAIIDAGLQRVPGSEVLLVRREELASP